MSEIQEKAKDSFFDLEGYNLMFADFGKAKPQKKKKKKIIPQKEEKMQISPIKTPISNNINQINKSENKIDINKTNSSLLNKRKSKEISETKNGSKFIGKKRFNENHSKEEFKGDKDEKTNKNENNLNNNLENKNTDIKENNKINYSPTREQNMSIEKIKYESSDEEKTDNFMPKSSFGKKIIVKNPEIKQNLDNKDYQVKKEKRKKLNDSNKVNPNNNTNHLNHLNNIKKKEFTHKNNDIRMKDKEINKHHTSQNNIKILNNSLNKKEYKEDKDIHNKINSHLNKDKQSSNKVKQNNLSLGKNKTIKNVGEKHNMNNIERKKEEIIKDKHSHNQNSVSNNKPKETKDIKEINKKIINKTNIEKTHKPINNSNSSNKNIAQKVNNTKPNLEKNKLNSSQKIKPKQSINSQNNIYHQSMINKNKISNNPKPQNSKITNTSQKNIINDKHSNTHTNNNSTNKNKIIKNQNSGNSKLDRIKSSLENRKLGPSERLLQPEKYNKSINNIIKPKKSVLREREIEGSEYDEEDSFIDDNNYDYEENLKSMKFMKRCQKYKESLKPYEIEGDVEVANSEQIAKEEYISGKIAQREDEQALLEIRANRDNEEEEDEDDY